MLACRLRRSRKNQRAKRGGRWTWSPGIIVSKLARVVPTLFFLQWCTNKKPASNSSLLAMVHNYNGPTKAGCIAASANLNRRKKAVWRQRSTGGISLTWTTVVEFLRSCPLYSRGLLKRPVFGCGEGRAHRHAPRTRASGRVHVVHDARAWRTAPPALLC